MVPSKTQPEKIYEVPNAVFQVAEESAAEFMSWGMTTMGINNVLPKVDLADRGGDLKIAIIDTGLNVGDVGVSGSFRYYFPDTQLEVYDVASGLATAEAVQDLNGHGTHVAGTVAEGMPEAATLLVIRAADAGSSSGDLHLDNILSAIDYAMEHDADIINMSFGASDYIEVLDDYLQAAAARNVISVAASGNNGKRGILYPANFDEVIAVGAVRDDLTRAATSNYGASLDYVAPGANIKSINGVRSGTSMATPHVAAAVGVLKSYNQMIGVDEVRELLAGHMRDLGAAGRDEEYGYGMIDLLDARMCTENVKCDKYGVFAVEDDDAEGAAHVVEVIDKTKGMAEVSLMDESLEVKSEKACEAIAENALGEYRVVAANYSYDASREYVLSDDVTKIYVVLKGDVNMNGKVNINDSAMINLSLISKSNKFYHELSELERMIADVNGNGKVNINDSAIINLSLIAKDNKFFAELKW